MQICRSAERVEILAPAKVNLFFEVLARREDGYHEIETLMVPIGLFDTLTLEDDPSGRMTLEVRSTISIGKQPSSAAPSVPHGLKQIEALPEGDDNIVVKALRLLAQRAARCARRQSAAGKADSAGRRFGRWIERCRCRLGGGQLGVATELARWAGWSPLPRSWVAMCRFSWPAGRPSAGDAVKRLSRSAVLEVYTWC